MVMLNFQLGLLSSCLVDYLRRIGVWGGGLGSGRLVGRRIVRRVWSRWLRGISCGRRRGRGLRGWV